MPFTISKPNFSPADLARVDPRILPYITGWQLIENYKDNVVIIPDYVVFNYFEDLDKGGDTSEYEKQLSIWCGWAGRSNGKDIDGLFDAECQITLSVNGPDAADVTKPTNVNIEILKSGGADMKLYYNAQLVTDFYDIKTFDFGRWLGKRNIKTPNGYQTRTILWDNIHKNPQIVA